MDELYSLVRLAVILLAANMVLILWVITWLWQIFGTLQSHNKALDASIEILSHMTDIEASALSILSMQSKEQVRP